MMTMLRLAFVVAAAMVAAVPSPKPTTIAIRQFQYAPVTVRVAVGDTVVWENHDLVPHTASADKSQWDSGDIPANAGRAVVMRKKGVHTYKCQYHPNMNGTVIVR